MPVEIPILDTNYKHLKIIQTWPKTTMIKKIITIARERERERQRETQTPMVYCL